VQLFELCGSSGSELHATDFLLRATRNTQFSKNKNLAKNLGLAKTTQFYATRNTQLRAALFRLLSLGLRTVVVFG
jgi:hypothetical protein